MTSLLPSLTSAGERTVAVPVGAIELPGTLAWPAHPSGIVLFAHGSGSSRLSPRNIAVARRLRSAGLATLLFDLLTPQEAEQRANVFEIPLLAKRLRAATDWVVTQPEVAGLAPGYFGAIPAPPRRSSRPRRREFRSAPSSPEAAGRISPATRCRRSARRRC